MSAPLKVLLVCQDFESEEEFLRPWTRFLVERRVSVAVAAPLRASQGLALRRQGVQLFHLDWAPGASLRQYMASFYDIFYAADSFGPHILHSLDRFSRLVIGLVGRRSSTPLLLHSQNHPPDLKNWLLYRWTHHELVPSGSPGPRRTIIVEGLPEQVRLERFLGVYRRLWSELGGSTRP